MIPTFLTTLAVGTITSVVASIMALSTWISGSAILQGNMFWDTTANASPKEYVNTTVVRTHSGAEMTTVNVGQRTQLYGDLTLAEIEGVASGALVITNPFDYYLLCDDIIVNVDTTATPTTKADVYFSTGSVTTLSQITSTGSNIKANYKFAAGLATMSGSALTSTYTHGGKFILAPSSSTTETKSVVFFSSTGTGQHLVGQYKIPCEFLKQ